MPHCHNMNKSGHVSYHQRPKPTCLEIFLPIYQEYGRIVLYLTDLDTNSGCIDRRAFAGMQYAIRKELDKTLQKNEIQNNSQETVLQPNDSKGDPKGNSDERLKINPSMTMMNGVTEDKDCLPEECSTPPESQSGIKELRDMLKLKTCVLPCKCGSELHNEATCSQMNIGETIVINSEEACQSEAEVDVGELRQYAKERLLFVSMKITISQKRFEVFL